MAVKKQMIILNKEGVETTVADDYALQPGEVKKEVPPASPVPPVVSEIDYEAEYFALLDKEAKTAQERDNYKKGLINLKKGILPDSEGTDLQELIQVAVKEELIKTKEFQTQKAKDELVKKMAKELAEARLALANKGQVITKTPGGSVEKPEVETVFWTAEQIAYFQKRGIDPEKVKANYLKAKSKVV